MNVSREGVKCPGFLISQMLSPSFPLAMTIPNSLGFDTDEIRKKKIKKKKKRKKKMAHMALLLGLLLGQLPSL